MTREQQLTNIVVEVADSLTADFDLIDHLQQLSTRSMELLDVAAVGILLADQHEHLQVLAASDEHTRLLELFALQHDQGPCVDAYRSGTPATNLNLHDPQATAHWPQFAKAAQTTGFVAASAIPMQLRGQVIGVMGLFQTAPNTLSPPDIQLAKALADLATISILQQRTLAAAELERGQLQYALTSRITLEQVKGILAERWQLSVDESFTAFRTYARSHHHQLTRLAQQIIDGQIDTDQIPHPTAPPKT
ncbi:GAF domain-containing protein [Streptomyces sp. NPDC058657]|uniref:GAF domain-containing protein n=1 Tax=unclassified Streptomyces TaxID=2593676 RepID=UPI0036473B48